MSFDPNINNLIFKVMELGAAQCVDKKVIDSKVRELSNHILKISSSEAQKRFVVSLITDRSIREELCNLIGIEKFEVLGEPPEIFNQYEFLEGMTNAHKVLLHKIIPEDKREEVLKRGERLIDQELSGQDKIVIFVGILTIFTPELSKDAEGNYEKFIQKIPSNQRADVISHALLFHHKGMGEDVFDLIVSLGETPQEERNGIAELACKFCKGMSGNQIAIIITEFGRVPRGEREDVANHVAKFFGGEGQLKPDIITGISSISLGQREGVIKLALEFFGRNEPHLGLIIRSFGPIPETERQDVAEHALKLFAKGLKFDIIIEALGKTPRDEREEFVKDGSKLLYPEMAYFIAARFLNEIPNEIRSDFVEQLIEEKTSGYELFDILEEMSKFQNREMFFSIVYKFKEIEGYPLKVIEYLTSRLDLGGSEDGIYKFYNYASSFFHKGMSINEMNQVVESSRFQDPEIYFSTVSKFKGIEGYPLEIVEYLISREDKNETYKLIEQSSSFFQKERSFSEIKQILDLIAIIPQEKRKNLILDAKRLYDDKMKWSDQMSVLFVMHATPYHNKNLEAAEKYFTPEMPWTTKLNLFLYLNKDDPVNSVIEQLIHPVMKEEDIEKDFEMDINLDDFFAPIPTSSMFADTDLVITKDDFKGNTLNGIKLTELKEIELMADYIFSGKTRILIDDQDKQFEKEVQGYIKKLLTRAVGRKLIKSVMMNHSIRSLVIKPGIKSVQGVDSHGNLYIKLSSKNEKVHEGHGKGTEIIAYSSPNFMGLGHELIHASHYSSYTEDLSDTNPTLHADYDNLEEQMTITGFRENIKLPEFSMSASLPFKEDGWDFENKQSVFNKRNFSEINERNLQAAFADSKTLFYPRSSHRGFSDKDTTTFLMKEKIANNLFHQMMNVPSDLRKDYQRLYNLIRPIK